MTTELLEVCIGEAYDVGLEAFKLDPWGNLPNDVFEGDDYAIEAYGRMCDTFVGSHRYFFDHSFELIETRYTQDKFITRQSIVEYARENIDRAIGEVDVYGIFAKFVRGDTFHEDIARSCENIYKKEKDAYVKAVLEDNLNKKEPVTGSPNKKLQ